MATTGANTYYKSQLDKENLVQSALRVNGQETPIEHLEIQQTFGSHNQITVLVDYERAGKKFISGPEDYIRLTGKNLHVQLRQGRQGKIYTYNGVITQVSIYAHEGKFGYIKLEATDQTIFMERGKNSDVYSEVSLKKQKSNRTILQTEKHRYRPVRADQTTDHLYSIQYINNTRTH